jgi:hypothetical protein
MSMSLSGVLVELTLEVEMNWSFEIDLDDPM